MKLSLSAFFSLPSLSAQSIGSSDMYRYQGLASPSLLFFPLLLGRLVLFPPRSCALGSRITNTSSPVFSPLVTTGPDGWCMSLLLEDHTTRYANGPLSLASLAISSARAVPARLTPDALVSLSRNRLPDSDGSRSAAFLDTTRYAHT